MALKLQPEGLRHTGGFTSVYSDGNLNTAGEWCPSGFGYSTSSEGHTTNGGNHGWVSLGATQAGSSPYPTQYYKIFDFNGGTGVPQNSDHQYLIWYNGDSNYANGGLYWLRLELWYQSNPNRLSGFSCHCVNGEPHGLLFLLNQTAGQEEIWVRGSRHWGSFEIKRIAGQGGPITSTDACAWYNDGPLVQQSTEPSGLTKVRGGAFCYNLENDSFLSNSPAGETW
jgi:hypothetical protein